MPVTSTTTRTRDRVNVPRRRLVFSRFTEPTARDEAGLAMIIAISVVMLMTLIPLAIYSQAVQQLPLARHDQDHEAALAAAEAGVDDYLNHLAQNQNYWTYNSSNLPPDGNQAFTTWVPVPGPNNNNEYFRYNVNSSQTPATGIVYVTASGCAAVAGACKATSPVRTVRAGLRRQGFLDYLWLTDYEITDPVLSGANASHCKFHAWEWNTVTNGNYGPDPGLNCSIVQWTTQAVLNGPVHSNDGLYTCGNPTVNGDTDTYYNSSTANNRVNSTRFGAPVCCSIRRTAPTGRTSVAPATRQAVRCSRSRPRTRRSATRLMARSAERAACTPDRRRSRCASAAVSERWT